MKKFIAALMITAMAATALIGCGSGNKDNSKAGSSTGTESNAKADNNQAADNNTTEGNAADGKTAGGNGLITVITREDGSGTRGAFIELFGVEEKDEAGNKIDHTTSEAVVANATEIVLTNVSSDPNAIGYVSLGALKDTVKALKINGAEATVENIKDGSYEISRPFNIATNGTPSEVTQDFINFILSADGQTIVQDNKYIPSVDNAAAYTSTQVTGKISIDGSSSISPLMEKLVEAYKTVNPNADIQLQTHDSTTGIQAVMDGTADIGMASRELKDTESAAVNGTVIAIDGIAVVVNPGNPVDDLSKDDVKAIFTGEKTTW